MSSVNVTVILASCVFGDEFSTMALLTALENSNYKIHKTCIIDHQFVILFVNFTDTYF